MATTKQLGQAPDSGTAFAPPARDSLDVVTAQHNLFLGLHGRTLLEALSSLILVLNGRRQVVYANGAVLAFLGYPSLEPLLGQRPGEILGCVNAECGQGGCGTSRHCNGCGAVCAILSALEGGEAMARCNVLRSDGTHMQGLDLEVKATPLDLDGERYVLFAIADISHEVRRRSVERIFFHDVLNLAGGISGLVDMLAEEAAPGQRRELAMLRAGTRNLVEEIVAQRDLLAAESNELMPRPAPVDLYASLRQLADLYACTPLAAGQIVRVDTSCAQLELTTDPRLLQRVLGNMVKNALEAGAPGDEVLLACHDEGERVRLSVHNPAAIDPQRQDDIFHRRFSTKGPGRGLGTYSMLLLGERVLGGSVGFSSSPEAGTTFYLLLPKRPEKA